MPDREPDKPTAMAMTPAGHGGGSMSGTDAVRFLGDPRERAISRDSERQALEDAADARLERAVERQAAERNAELKSLGRAAEARAGEIAANQWHLPVSGYRLTAQFGMGGGLWSSNHTGLDMAAPSGTPIVAVANGTITETGSAGAYGNQTIQTLEDGTEIWYCHQTTIDVEVGETVTGGQQIGTVGSTGNSTGPHLHIEVRPGGGDPVDPYQAMVHHGLKP
jgi:murein DD-endopeptidase MepM/ murein hydrolase activator NlpD